MTTMPSSLEIHVHTADGGVTKFSQSDPVEMPNLLAHIQPGKVFSQPLLFIAGNHSMSAFPTEAVARVDIVMEGHFDWPFHFGVQDSIEISEEEFRERYRPE